MKKILITYNIPKQGEIEVSDNLWEYVSLIQNGGDWISFPGRERAKLEMDEKAKEINSEAIQVESCQLLSKLEEGICIKCGSDDVECSDNCTRHICVACKATQ